jgi:hypothetical protein
MNVSTRWLIPPILALAAVLAGCQSSQQNTEQTTAPQNETETKVKKAKAQNKGEEKREAATKAPEKQVVTLTVPAGTTLEVRLANAISSGSATAGAEFQGTLASALTVNGVEIAPVGAAVSGTVTNAVSSGRLNRPAQLGLRLTSVTVDGSPMQVSTNAWTASGQSHTKRDAELIGGGAAVGGLVGALAGKGKGAAIGALVGGGAGSAGAAATGKKEIVLAAETKVPFTLSAPISVTRTQ